MKNWRKALTGSGGAILLLALAGSIALHTLVDPERLKEIAREKVQAAWSRDLHVVDVSLDLLPVPALHAEQVALSNPPWAQEPHFLRAESVTARLELLPLLTGKVRLKSLHIEGLKAELETSPDGASNFPESSSPRSTGPDLLDLTAIRVTNADIYQRSKDEAPVLWHVDEVTFDASRGLRDAHIAASLLRNDRPLAMKARLADLSRIGNPGATTEGEIHLDWGRSQLAITGRFPLSKEARGYAVTAVLRSSTPAEVFEFFGVERRPKAPAQLRAVLRDDAGKIGVTQLAFTLGKLQVTGSGQLTLAGPVPAFDLRLDADRLDWTQTLLDAGGPPIPPLPPEQMFHDLPLAWPLLVAMQGKRGTAELQIKSLRLRNGVELRDARAHLVLDGDTMKLQPFSAEMLGGTAKGSMEFEGRKKRAKVDFTGTNLLLERWFKERGSKIALTGGPMQVTATFSSTGNSIKELAAGMTGPATIRMGRAVWTSQKASDAEAMMTNVFASRDDKAITFECVGAAMPFKSGKAVADPIVGFRTTASDLLTSGSIDFRAQRLDLRGRVRPREGVQLGLASIAGDVKIEGPLRRPKMQLDPGGKPAAVLRAGAAIATLGLSAVGTALADAAEAKKNAACEAVFRRRPR
jgi:uncharacterized protein involved in outer membrane biogenesis